MKNILLKIQQNDQYSGTLAGIIAFSSWGLLVLLWYPLKELPAAQILAYRIIASFLTLLPLMFYFKKFQTIKESILSPKTLAFLLLSTILIGLNWYLYIWTVIQGKILEISIGYYISPLFNIILGAMFFKERPSKLQMIAICIAFIGVLWSVLAYGKFPFLSFILAIMFSLYGLVRKVITVDPLSVTIIENIFLLPIAVIWIMLTYSQIDTHFFSLSIALQLIIISTGIATTLPLILFAYAAKRIQLSTLGILDYISPSITFLIGIFVMGEVLTTDTLITFICLWIAFILYAYCAFKRMCLINSIAYAHKNIDRDKMI